MDYFILEVSEIIKQNNRELIQLIIICYYLYWEVKLQGIFRKKFCQSNDIISLSFSIKISKIFNLFYRIKS